NLIKRTERVQRRTTKYILDLPFFCERILELGNLYGRLSLRAETLEGLRYPGLRVRVIYPYPPWFTAGKRRRLEVATVFRGGPLEIPGGGGFGCTITGEVALLRDFVNQMILAENHNERARNNSRGTQPKKIHEFFESLVTNTQALETMGLKHRASECRSLATCLKVMYPVVVVIVDGVKSGLVKLLRKKPNKTDQKIESYNVKVSNVQGTFEMNIQLCSLDNLLWDISNKHSYKVKKINAKEYINWRHIEHLNPSLKRSKLDKKVQPEQGSLMDRGLSMVKIKVPVVDKTCFKDFWKLFSSLVDSGNEPANIKMARLRQSLKGTALEAIRGLGLSLPEYEEAKEILKTKFGGRRQQLQAYMDQLEAMPSLKGSDVQGFERFADLVRITVVKLQAEGRDGELGEGNIKRREPLKHSHYEQFRLQE
ncbi:Hypothetical predicted protein, partial [Paramuricea clavata]